MPERDQLKLAFLRKPASWLPSLRVNTYRDFHPPLPHHRSNPCRQENEAARRLLSGLEASTQEIQGLCPFREVLGCSLSLQRLPSPNRIPLKVQCIHSQVSTGGGLRACRGITSVWADWVSTKMKSSKSPRQSGMNWTTYWQVIPGATIPPFPGNIPVYNKSGQ